MKKCAHVRQNVRKIRESMQKYTKVRKRTQKNAKERKRTQKYAKERMQKRRKRIDSMCKGLKKSEEIQGSISSTFYEQLFRRQIQKVRKDWWLDCLLVLLGSASIKADCKMLMKLNIGGPVILGFIICKFASSWSTKKNQTLIFAKFVSKCLTFKRLYFLCMLFKKNSKKKKSKLEKNSIFKRRYVWKSHLRQLAEVVFLVILGASSFLARYKVSRSLVFFQKYIVPS
jgi:hypothetical protein